MFLVDVRGRVIGADPDGRRMLGHTLSLVNGRLATANARCGTPDLAHVVKRALSSDVGARTVEIVRNCEHTPFLVHVIRFAPIDGHTSTTALEMESALSTGAEAIALRDEAGDAATSVAPVGTPYAIVSVSELITGTAPVAPELLMSWLKLTDGEARLAVEVARGFGPREAAEQLGLTENSARVILKRVFAKAGVSSQPQLVALIGRLRGLAS